MKKKLISLLLVLVLLFQISGSALAAIGNYFGNTPAQNQALFDQLAALTGGTSDEARALLSRLGLLDKDGNLDLTATITMDGKSMTVDQVRSMLAEPGTDLTKIVNVDGMTLTLGDLQTMLNIEAELARIQETYFSGKTFGADATDNLNSLMSQIETQGIGVHSEGRAALPYWEITGLTDGKLSLMGGTSGEYFQMKVVPADQTTRTLRFTVIGTGATVKYKVGGGEYQPIGTNGTVSIESNGTIDLHITPGSNGDSVNTTSVRMYLTIQADSANPVPLTEKRLNTCVIPIEISKNNSFSWANVQDIYKNGYTDSTIRNCEFDATIRGNSYFKLPLVTNCTSKGPDFLTYLSSADLFRQGIALDIKTSIRLMNNTAMYVPPKAGEEQAGSYALVYPDSTPGEPNHIFFYGTASITPGELTSTGEVPSAALRNSDGKALAGTTTFTKGIDSDAPGKPITTLNVGPARDPAAPQIPLTSGQCLINPPTTTTNIFTPIAIDVPVPGISFTLGDTTAGLNLTIPSEKFKFMAKNGNGEAGPATAGPFNYDELEGKYWNPHALYADTIPAYQNRIRVYAGECKLTFTETSIPEIKTITVPAGEYVKDQVIPVMVQFSEPVECCSVKINDVNSPCVDKGANSYSDVHFFEYTVKKADSTTLVVEVPAGMSDPFGHSVGIAKNAVLTDTVTLVTTLMQDAVTGTSATPASLKPTEAAEGTTLNLSLLPDLGYQTKYADYDKTPANKAPFVARLRGTNTLIPFTLTENSGRNITGATAPTGALEFGTEQKTYTYDILAYEYDNATSTWSTDPVDTGKYVSVKVNPMVFADVNAVTYPSEDKIELSLTDPYVPKLGVSFKNDPTFQTGAWTSSDSTIAAIDSAGQVTLAGQKLGKVTFTFTADDGKIEGATDPNVGEKTKSVTSKEYNVTAGGEAGIVVPKGGDTIIALEKSKAQVRWYGNMAQYLNPVNSDHVKYTVEVFNGNLKTEEEFTGGTVVHTSALLPMTDTSYEIPANLLTNLSTGTVPAYTVRISAPHPVKTVADNDIRLYTYAYIIVNPVPVTVKVTPPEKLYALDSAGAASVGWTIENYKEGTTTATLTVERVTEAGVTTKVVADKPIVASGTEQFTPEKVTGDKALRDLYVVTVAAKNKSDTVWNSDSYQFYVYKDGALDIVVGENKEKENNITLSNRKNPLVTTLPTETDGIMELRGKLGLNAPVGINYADYAWSALKDGIKWDSSDKTKVGLNFKQGSFYESVDRFNYDSYLPATTMAIAGLGETESTIITATHANTGMATTLDVKVESLENHLYLFQMTPMLKTTLTYTDGKGAKKSIDTNDKGTLALYEPNGIEGAAYFRAIDVSDENALYLGTIFPGTLRSGEGNTLVRELYPINTLDLRKVARTDLFLKKPDGTPYSGTVTVRGGVYKNGGYCQGALFGLNEQSLKDGKLDQKVTVPSTGKLTIQMDSTQFWSAEKGENDKTELQSTDKLEYIFELTGITAGGKHYPVLAYVDGVSPVSLGSRTGEGVFTLETADKESIFLASQRTMDKNGDRHDVRKRAAYAGPNETTPKGTDLESTMLLWGETTLATKDYSVQLLDEFGFQPPTQKSETITYPFSSIPVVRNTMTLTPETLTESGWVPEGQPRGIKLQVLKNRILQKDIPTDIKVADLSKVPPLKGETATNIMVDLTKGSSVSAPAEMDHKNAVVKGLMKRLSGGGGEGISGPVDTSMFKMIISPGDDSATFKAFVWAGYNSLGLEDAEYDDNGLSVTPHLLEDELSTGFGGGDAAALADGAQEAAQTGADLAKTGKSVSGGGSFGGQLEGYYECLIKFNFKTQQWEIFTLGGGFTVGFGGSFGKSINQMVGPIPITASFELGAAIQLDFKMASRYKVMGEGLDWSDSYKDKQYVSDFLTTLRINAYFEAFGGIGFDISIVALKFGVYGRLGVDNSNAFLSRPYLKNEALRQTNGQALKLTGEVGIKFVLTIIGIIDYEATLASIDMAWSKTFRDWQNIEDYWANTGSGISLDALAVYGAQSGLTLVDASASLQSRDYLDDFERTWAAPRRMARSLDESNGLSGLQTNAYPNSLPRITDDGQYLLYTSEQGSRDLASARIYETGLKTGAYPEGKVIAAPTDFEGFGDSDLRLAGKKDLAVAAWVRQSVDNQLKPDDKVTNNLQSVLTNATEIVASVNTGSGWTSTRLTTNGSPDLAPVVAANDEKAMVAWRSVYAADAEKPMDFTAQDKVLYKIYDKAAGTWSGEQTLYPGTSGVVKGIEAAMLPDGTAAVTYVLDRSGIGDAATYEVAASIVKADGTPGRTLMLTSDNYSDENPQIAAVDCGTLEASDPRFVIGWYSTKGEGGDIRMAALDAEGLPSATFPESLGQISKETMIGNNFRFVAADKLEDLSVLWSVTSQNQTAKGDQLLGVKFLPKDGKIGLSAPIDVATLPPNTNTDHFDAYVSNAATNEIKAVIQGTLYAPVDKTDPTTYDKYSVTDEDEDGNEVQKDVYVPKAKTMLYTATETYANKMTLTQVWADYANLALNSLLPVQFTVQNSGFETLNSVSVKLDEKTQDFTVNLAPNESTTLTLYYAVGGTVGDVNYSITPTFVGSSPAKTDGVLHLDYPDLGIAGFKVMAEQGGKRDLRITLYNGGAAKLDKANRSINIAFYDNSLLEGDAVDVTYNGSLTKKITISDTDRLALADNGALCADLSFDVSPYKDGTTNELPPEGVRLYAKVWVQDSAKVLPEFHNGNNSASVQLDSLLYRAEEPVTITVAQSLNEDGKTVAGVTVRNNSLSGASSGNLVVNLLDQSGNVLETQQSYQPLGRAINSGLLSLGGEESETVNFTFSQPGASVKVTYGALVLNDNTNAELTSLSATGIPVRLADFKVDPEDGTKFTASVSTAAGKTLITASTKDPGATVTVNGAPMAAGGAPLALTTGENQITIAVTARDGTTKRTYELTAERTTSDPSGVTSYVISAKAGPGGTISPTGNKRVNRGRSQTYTVTPNQGYVISDVLVDGVSAGKVTTYTFEKVKEKHTIEAKFAPWEMNYKDVKAADWFYPAVEFVSQHDLMKGVGDDRFHPYGTSSRSTIVAVLYRMAGSPVVTEAPAFDDVPAGQWYSDAVAWAAATGVAQGNEKKFTPDADATREQLAQLFYTYAQLEKYDMTASSDLAQFSDSPTGWSRKAMAWAVGSGIITGKGNGTLDPTGKATRAELAVMLMKLQKLEKPEKQ